MREIAVVLVADEFEQLRIRQQPRVLSYGPRLRVGAGVVDRDLDLHVAEVPARRPPDNVHLLRRRFPALTEPCLAVESARLDDERVAVPRARRITEPRR